MIEWMNGSRLLKEAPERLTEVTSWHTHLPFAFWSIEAFRPRTFVELGTHWGDSYCGFCQAVDRLALSTRCNAVDTWRGDGQTGPYGEKVLRDLRRHHDRRYGRFSRLIRSTFDEARAQFADGSIDLLHIDGFHTYEAVRHDFETWLPAMSRAGVILFHDVAVRERDFGVFRLWDEVRARYPSFTFQHGHGLGVLVVGPEAPELAHRLAACDEREAEEIRALFERLGEAAAALRPPKGERRALRRRISEAASAGELVVQSGARDLGERRRRRQKSGLIRQSGLFDSQFYLSQCPDDHEASRDPIRHYLLGGAAAGLDPNPFFDTSYYVEQYPDVAASGKNPLVHFIRHGALERRAPSARFDTAYYLARHRDVVASGLNPLAHYLAVGAAEGRPCQPKQRDARPVLGDVLDRAADFANSRRARRILVVDQRLPTPDQDSGSVRMFAILTLLRRLGHEIVFVSDSAEAEERYERAVRRLGIDVLYGFCNAVEHLATQGHEYGVALLSRPQTAERYLTPVRAYALRATVVYDTVDLHWIRFERAARVTGDPRAHADAERFRRLERLNTACADLTLSVTEQERELLLREVPGARVEIVPNIHRCEETSPPWEARRDLMFIGGFEHAPNVDAVEWFVERIFPLVQRDLPGAVFQVVGSKVPERVQRLESSTVRIVGQVPSVGPLFDSSRVFVSPLRYGAGMKGKIGQSMGLGLPVVTTSIGAEGMSLVDGENALIADDPAEFAAAVVRLYTDQLLWSRVARNSMRHIQENFSAEAVLGRLGAIFPTVPTGAADGDAERTTSPP